MFSVGFLGGFLVGLLVLVTALVSSGHRDGHHDRHHNRHHDKHLSDMRDHMGGTSNHGSMRDHMGHMGNDGRDSMRDYMEGMYGDSYGAFGVSPAAPEDIWGYMQQAPNDSASQTAPSHKEALKMFEDFINREREAFKERLSSLPKDKHAAEQESFDKWLKDRREEFARNNPQG